MQRERVREFTHNGEPRVLLRAHTGPRLGTRA